MKQVVLYGYAQEAYQTINNLLQALFSEPIEILSSSDKTDIIENIIQEKIVTFQKEDSAFFMMNGFSDEDIKKIITQFPQGISRPLFCVLTETNMTWTPAYLLEHLQEEREAYLKAQKAQKAQKNKKN